MGPPEYATVEFDAATQLTHFYDARGEIVDMQRGTVTKSPKNQGNDGTGGPLVSDDSDD